MRPIDSLWLDRLQESATDEAWWVYADAIAESDPSGSSALHLERRMREADLRANVLLALPDAERQRRMGVIAECLIRWMEEHPRFLNGRLLESVRAWQVDSTAESGRALQEKIEYHFQMMGQFGEDLTYEDYDFGTPLFELSYAVSFYRDFREQPGRRADFSWWHRGCLDRLREHRRRLLLHTIALRA